MPAYSPASPLKRQKFVQGGMPPVQEPYGFSARGIQPGGFNARSGQPQPMFGRGAGGVPSMQTQGQQLRQSLPYYRQPPVSTTPQSLQNVPMIQAGGGIGGVGTGGGQAFASVPPEQVGTTPTPIQFQPGMHRGDVTRMNSQRAKQGLLATTPLDASAGYGNAQQNAAAYNDREQFFAGSQGRLQQPPMNPAPQQPVRQSALAGYGQPNPALSAADAILGAGAGAGATPQQPPPIGSSPLQNYPTGGPGSDYTVTPPGMRAAAPNYSQTPGQAARSYADTVQGAKVDTQNRVGEMQSEGTITQTPGAGALTGAYTASSGRQLQISPSASGGIRIAGKPVESTLSPDQIAKGRGRQAARKSQRRNEQIINSARRYGLPAATTPAVRTAYKELDIPLPGTRPAKSSAPVASSGASPASASPSNTPTPAPQAYFPPGTPGGLPLMTGPVAPGAKPPVPGQIQSGRPGHPGLAYGFPFVDFSAGYPRFPWTSNYRPSSTKPRGAAQYPATGGF